MEIGNRNIEYRYNDNIRKNFTEGMVTLLNMLKM